MKAIFEQTQYDKVVALIKQHHDRYPGLVEVQVTPFEWENLICEMQKQYHDVQSSHTCVIISGVPVRVKR